MFYHIRLTVSVCRRGFFLLPLSRSLLYQWKKSSLCEKNNFLLVALKVIIDAKRNKKYPISKLNGVIVMFASLLFLDQASPVQKPNYQYCKWFEMEWMEENVIFKMVG